MDPAEPAMLDVIVDIWPILASLAAGLAAVGWALWKIYVHQEAKFLKELKDDKSLQNHHLKFKRLSSRKRRIRYAARLRWSLGALSRFFGSRAFSVKSYELCLTWAFIYPIMLGLLFWLGSNQDISGFGVFPPIEEGRFWKAPLVPILIVGMTYSFYKFYKEDGVKGLIWLAFAVAVAFAVAFAFAFAFAFAVDGAFAVAVDGAFAFAVAFAVAFAFALALAVAGAVAVAFAVAVAVAGAGAVAVAVTFAGAGAGAFAFAFAVALAVAFAGAGAFAGAFAILITYSYFLKKGNRLLFYILYFSFLVVCIGVFLAQPWLPVNELSFGILLFLVVLPIINSILDWLSLGVTRLLLKKSLRAPTHIKKAGYYLLDFVAALITLLVLIFSLFLVIKGMSLAAGLSALEQPAYDLGALWQRIDSRPVWQTLLSPDGWVFMMIFSTFLPSLLHGLAFGGFLLTITQPDRSKISRFVSYTATDYPLAVKEKNEIAGYLARQSIANVAFPVIGVLLLAGIILALLLSFGDILAGVIGG